MGGFNFQGSRFKVQVVSFIPCTCNRNDFNRGLLVVKNKLWYKDKFIFVKILTLIVTFGRVLASVVAVGYQTG
jgi:hypothetical protein